LAGISLRTPRARARRAGIVTFAAAGADPVRLHSQLRDRGVICAARCGGVRFSPHFYTGRARIDRALSILRGILS